MSPWHGLPPYLKELHLQWLYLSKLHVLLGGAKDLTGYAYTRYQLLWHSGSIVITSIIPICLLFTSIVSVCLRKFSCAYRLVVDFYISFYLFVFSRCSVRFTFVNVLFILLSVTWYVFMVIANGCVIIMDVSTVVMPMKYIHVYMPNEEWGRNKKLIRWYWVLNLTTCDCQRKWYHKCTWWYSKKYDLLERS